MSEFDNTKTMQAYLADCAQRLQFRQRSVPIYLRQICQSVGVGVSRSSKAAGGKAYLNWSRDKPSSPVIVLPEIGSLNWDRFCAAHELAHFFLISRFDWMPETKSEYWKTEELCDEFARKLLIPTSLLSKLDEDDAPNFSVLQRTRQASRIAMVPWSHFVIALTRIRNHRFFFSGDMPTDRTSCLVTSSTLPAFKGRASIIKLASPVMEKLRSSAVKAWEQRSEVYFDADADDFCKSRLREILRELGVVSLGVMVEPTRHRVFITGKLPVLSPGSISTPN